MLKEETVNLRKQCWQPHYKYKSNLLTLKLKIRQLCTRHKKFTLRIIMQHYCFTTTVDKMFTLWPLVQISNFPRRSQNLRDVCKYTLDNRRFSNAALRVYVSRQCLHRYTTKKTATTGKIVDLECEHFNWSPWILSFTVPTIIWTNLRALSSVENAETKRQFKSIALY